jgi:hypothetical protein
MSAKPNIGSYLKLGRLADVLTLIQVLSYCPSSRRTDEGLHKELTSKPQTADTWIQLAEQHPEFFRVRSDVEKPIVALVSRFVQKPEVTPNGEEQHPPLSPDISNNLMGLAVELHDREVTRSQNWHVYIPLIVAVTAGVFTLFGVILKGWLGGTP